jgi:hypothetical protein
MVFCVDVSHGMDEEEDIFKQHNDESQRWRTSNEVRPPNHNDGGRSVASLPYDDGQRRRIAPPQREETIRLFSEEDILFSHDNGRGWQIAPLQRQATIEPLTLDEGILFPRDDGQSGQISSPQQQAVTRSFTPDEDILLVDLVQRQGLGDWGQIAAMMDNKTARQCRERYHNYLQDEPRNPDWTFEEDAILVTKYNELGPNWEAIARFLSSRISIFIKNRFEFLQREEKRIIGLKPQ